MTQPTTNGDPTAFADDDDLLEDGAPDLGETEPAPDDTAIDDLTDDIEPGEPADSQQALAAFEPAGGDDLAARLSRLELAAEALVATQVDKDGRRVHRKVSAASLGAFVAAAVPVLLDLVGALNLSPELTSTISAGAALIGAFAAGWATPERSPTLPPEILSR